LERVEITPDKCVESAGRQPGIVLFTHHLQKLFPRHCSARSEWLQKVHDEINLKLRSDGYVAAEWTWLLWSF
jgi:hypothetical protein